MAERDRHRVTGSDAEEPLAYLPLPGGLDDPRAAARVTFDRQAAAYDRARPGYPPEAIGDLAARCKLGPDSRVLEVGCGTGQATGELARLGCSIRCLEPGPHLAELARRKLAANPRVQVATSTFEAADEAPGSYDAVVSATAFHWIDPALSFSKAASLLRPQGSLALLTNLHAAGGTQERIADEIRELHLRLAPDVGSWTFPWASELRTRAQAGGDIAAVWYRVERKLSEPPSVAHLFEMPVVSTYPWMASYDRDGYLTNLSTQSTYALMDPSRRDRLLSAIGELIDERLGGTLTKQYMTVLATAKRRPGARASQ